MPPFNMAKTPSYCIKTTPKLVVPPPPPSVWLKPFPHPLFVGVKLHMSPPPLPFCSPPSPLLVTSPLCYTSLILFDPICRYQKSRAIHPPASDEKRLTKYLLSNYRKVGRGGRPVSNSSSAVLVKFGLAMIQMGLDEKDNMLTSSVWCRYVSN